MNKTTHYSRSFSRGVIMYHLVLAFCHFPFQSHIFSSNFMTQCASPTERASVAFVFHFIFVVSTVVDAAVDMKELSGKNEQATKTSWSVYLHRTLAAISIHITFGANFLCTNVLLFEYSSLSLFL